MAICIRCGTQYFYSSVSKRPEAGSGFLTLSGVRTATEKVALKNSYSSTSQKGRSGLAGIAGESIDSIYYRRARALLIGNGVTQRTFPGGEQER